MTVDKWALKTLADQADEIVVKTNALIAETESLRSDPVHGWACGQDLVKAAGLLDYVAWNLRLGTDRG